MKKKNFLLGVLTIFAVTLYLFSYAQDEAAEAETQAVGVAELEEVVKLEEAADPAQDSRSPAVQSLTATENVTLDFKEADINNVLKIISYKAGINIVTTPEVMGTVSVRLVDVHWEQALGAILKTHGFAYSKQGNIITVAPVEKLTEIQQQEVQLEQVQPTVTQVFTLKYIDSQDAKKAIEPQLSPRGKITVLEMTGQAGWEFGADDMAKRKRLSEEELGRSKVLIVTDIPPVIDKIIAVVEQVDVRPVQVLIETRIIEVNKDYLRDIGFDWGTGSGGATSSTLTGVDAAKSGYGDAQMKIAGNLLGSQVTPAGFGASASTIAGTEPFNTGLSLLFQKLSGTQFEILIHALEEDVDTNTLSAPRIMALNNQEATILIGTRYPILKQDTTTSGSNAVTTITLDYYQDIGIQLNVVPQVGANNYINMVVHPAVTSYTQTLGTSPALYPIIETREAETRVLMEDGETVVIGGLLKDVKTKNRQGIPFLSKIPLLGVLFSRDTVDLEKIDLLIFITARIIS
ncbi:secretin and TonB N-terminal domain-containing protein [Candidatus Omnitrophota bacterium]